MQVKQIVPNHVSEYQMCKIEVTKHLVFVHELNIKL